MSFTIVPNLANVKGVFQDKYKMYSPFKKESEARDFFGTLKNAESAIYCKSNFTLYVQERKNEPEELRPEPETPATPTRVLPPTFPKPKPESEKPKTNWFGGTS